MSLAGAVARLRAALGALYPAPRRFAPPPRPPGEPQHDAALRRHVVRGQQEIEEALARLESEYGARGGPGRERERTKRESPGAA